MKENKNLELANTYFLKADKNFFNENIQEALTNYLQGSDLIGNIPANVKINMGLCYAFLDDKINCLQTLSSINIDELCLFEDYELKLMFFYLADAYFTMEYSEHALDIVNFNLKIKTDTDTTLHAMILDQKILILNSLNLTDEVIACADELINFINYSNESSKFLESKIALAFISKAAAYSQKDDKKNFKHYLKIAKTHAQKSDDETNITKLISDLEK